MVGHKIVLVPTFNLNEQVQKNQSGDKGRNDELDDHTHNDDNF
jgi:hypothetical protein